MAWSQRHPPSKQHYLNDYSDGLKLYFYALTAHFGNWIETVGRKTRLWQVRAGLLYGQVVKHYTNCGAGAGDWARRVHLILDGGSSHTSGDTQACWAEMTPRVQVLLTPADASWLNQAELLLDAFSARYLQRDSQATRPAMIDHILKGRAEYIAYFAHPFAWHWSVQRFQFWLNNTPGLIRCRTSATGHQWVPARVPNHNQVSDRPDGGSVIPAFAII